MLPIQPLGLRDNRSALRSAARGCLSKTTFFPQQCARVASNHYGDISPQGPQPDRGGVDGGRATGPAFADVPANVRLARPNTTSVVAMGERALRKIMISDPSTARCDKSRAPTLY